MGPQYIKMTTGSTVIRYASSYTTGRMCITDANGHELSETEDGTYVTFLRKYTPADFYLPMFIPIRILLLRHLVGGEKMYTCDYKTVAQDRLEMFRLAIAQFDQIRELLRGLPQPIFEAIEEEFF